MSGKIEHNGIIVHIDGKHIRVRIVQSSACSSCQAKTICSSSESKEKIIDVFSYASSNYKIGENVKVCASESMGRNAVIFAFVIPLIVMMIWISISIKCLMMNEPMSIVISLMFLALYYWMLSINKKRISRKFAFWIEKP